MPSEKRQRQRENRMLRATEQEQTQKRGRRFTLTVRVVVIAVVLLGAAFLYSVLTDDSEPESTIIATPDTVTVSPDNETFSPADETDDAGTPTPETGSPSSESPETDNAGGDSTDNTGTDTDNTADAGSDATDTATDSTDNNAADNSANTPTLGTGECPAEDGSSPPAKQFAASPQLCIDPDQLYAADFETTMGDFTMVLDPSLDIASVNNFIVLARYGAYDGTIFHRVISDFVVQGGDVLNQLGTGTPGYSFTGVSPPAGWYRVGSVAMANSTGPSSNGSQFFIITGPNGAALPPNYSPMGVVTEGIDVVLAVDAVETGERTQPSGFVASNVPVEDVIVTSVRIREATDADLAGYEAS